MGCTATEKRIAIASGAERNLPDQDQQWRSVIRYRRIVDAAWR